jgi:hypothetical protein
MFREIGIDFRNQSGKSEMKASSSQVNRLRIPQLIRKISQIFDVRVGMNPSLQSKARVLMVDFI